MKILITGAAGFIGFHTARRFLERGDQVVGVDDLNAYYPVSLKKSRLAKLEQFDAFSFHQTSIARTDLGDALNGEAEGIDAIVHFAAQAGVRYSTENPYVYVESNVTGQVAIFELAARLPNRPPVIYSSSSSVYGAHEEVPFRETARADSPVSIYAATKRAGELLAHAYRDLHGVRSVALRLFTVYGPYGRPDMAPWLFTEAILQGRPIAVFNGGDMLRDFTYVDDIVSGVVAATDRMVSGPEGMERVYNLGNNEPVRLVDFIAAIEAATGRKAVMEMKPKPPGDVVRTCADISLAQRDLGFAPRTKVADGMTRFVAWFNDYTRQ